jgi:hypothetical protein
MAVIKKKILGEISGNLGDVIFRTRNGKTVVYSKPSKLKVSKSESSIKVKNRFGLVVSLAKEIISDETLSLIWNKSKVEATNGYQKIIKHNTKLISEGSLTLANQIVPNGISSNSISLNYHNKNIDIKINYSDLLNHFDKLFTLYCIVHSWKSNHMVSKKLSKKDYLTKLHSFNILSQIINEDNLFSININSSKKLKHNKLLVFATIVGEKNKKMIWTKSFAKLIEI